MYSADMEIITDPKEAKRILAEHFGWSKAKKKKWNSGRRADLNNIFFRSGTEANVARYLNFLKAHGQIVDWLYEPKRFMFDEIKRGVNSYLPDFQVWSTKCAYSWWELKGWRHPKGEVALRRMAKYYPDEKIVVIDKKAYAEIRRQVAGLIPFWEGER